VARVAVVRSTATSVALKEYEVAGRALEMRVQVVDVAGPEDLERALAAVARDRVDAVIVPADPSLFTHRQRLTELAREHRLPGIYSTREYTEAGGLMSYSARISDQFRRAAVFVDKILRGARPATLPVESPSQYELVINLKTAKALGIKMPHALVVRADEVIQ
jgi:putative ABC transport system substrate-binding protein